MEIIWAKKRGGAKTMINDLQALGIMVVLLLQHFWIWYCTRNILNEIKRNSDNSDKQVTQGED